MDTHKLHHFTSELELNGINPFVFVPQEFRKFVKTFWVNLYEENKYMPMKE